MRRVIAIAVAGASLAGCSSFSFDSLRPAPPTVQVQLESVPSGAEATTSLGPGCKTPCSLAVPASDSGFSVTYALNKFQPVGPPPKAVRKMLGPKKPKKPKGVAAAAPGGSPFPAPPPAPPPPPPPT